MGNIERIDPGSMALSSSPCAQVPLSVVVHYFNTCYVCFTDQSKLGLW